MAKPLQRFLQVLVCLWIISFVFGWIEGRIFHWPGASWYPLFPPQARFTDLTIFQDRFRYFHQLQFFAAAGFPFTYPAPVALVCEGFFVFGRYALDAYLCFSLVVLASAAALLGRALFRRGMGIGQTVGFLGVSLLFAYPFWFLVDRGNIEIVNWCLVALGVAAYWNKRWYLAAALLGVAVSFKIFPFVFFGLLLSARKYRAIAFGVLVCGSTTILSTWLVGPTYRVASEGIAHGLEFFRMHYALQVRGQEIGFDHSAFAIVKELVYNRSPGPLYYLPWLNGYMIAAASAGILLYFWKIRALPRPNQILALTVASVLLPPVSADYTLVHLYVPWGVLVLVSASVSDPRKVRGLILSMSCMAFLMAPESFVVLHGFKFGGQLKALVLVGLLWVSIAFPIKESVPAPSEETTPAGLFSDGSTA